ncbi:MAG TPA: M67 family metallopeptidase [Candidatus Sulfomarinibacteraceae bacterium]|nr:M67 family metallopeptidase [Candidatus Sulfomarinibacteraceae bacterium]
MSTSSGNPAGHPGPAAIHLPDEIRAGIVAHARAELPNEACGVIVGDRPAAEGGRPLRWEPTRNRAASPFRYEIHPEDLLRLTIETDDADEVFWGIVHSHVASPARPSPTDIGLAFYADALFILVSLHPDEADDATGAPGVRAWRIVDGTVHEVAIVRS